MFSEYLIHDLLQLVAQMNHQRNDVSGYQRVRACKELGIPKINCEVRIYSSEDEVLQDLIETNIRQRGSIDGSTRKNGMIAKELERIYGVRNGSAGKRSLEPNNSGLTQKDIADKMRISVDTLQNYKKLTEMIPELEELVDTGIVSNTTALAIVR